MEYFLKLKGLWKEVVSHFPLPMCTCIHKCRCAALRTAQEYKLEDQAIKVLTGLNDNVSFFKTQVFFMDPFPSINHIYLLVTQEESTHKNLVLPDDSFILINVAQRP